MYVRLARVSCALMRPLRQAQAAFRGRFAAPQDEARGWRRVDPHAIRFRGRAMTRELDDRRAALRQRGKMTATLGLLRAFRRRGVDVVGLKSGPDYIDPAFHAAATQRLERQSRLLGHAPGARDGFGGAGGSRLRSCPVRRLDGAVRRRARRARAYRRIRRSRQGAWAGRCSSCSNCQRTIAIGRRHRQRLHDL